MFEQVRTFKKYRQKSTSVLGEKLYAGRTRFYNSIVQRSEDESYADAKGQNHKDGQVIGTEIVKVDSF